MDQADKLLGCVSHKQLPTSYLKFEHFILNITFEVEGLYIYFFKYQLAINLFIYKTIVDHGDWLVSNDI